ncbi:MULTISPECIES: DUF3800 domain-containing protein [unclassified Bradyrhizobium]|uniref:DUF3800 domain-containing protein n=1 Tax=unclassified Bradyrhizobium TaxID=2631580 RepID=UPI0028E8DFC9|nr:MULTISPECIES: DUF3800 domain-containing protein [unclassified Bradyrhizobium]
MTCRLFIDEVGNADVKTPSERFLSVTGIITKVHGHQNIITPEIEKLKKDLFNHDPITNPVILHRKEIVRKEKPFGSLQDLAVNAEWETRILGLIETLPYIAVTVIIDKLEHQKKYQVWHFNPYHYCMTALVERYVLWLNAHNLIGDVVAEPRFKLVDKKLKAAFQHFYYEGTDNIPSAIVQARLTSHELKFEPKSSNICGLQLVEMIAHPSHHNLRSTYPGEAPMTAPFGLRVVDILNRERYRRHPKTGKIEGYGTKCLP